MKNEITKEILDDLYCKKNISTHKIARILGCSSETVANRCREYGILLKGPGKRKKKIDKENLVKLYIKEGKTLTEITKILGCSYSRIRNYCLEYGIRGRNEIISREIIQKSIIVEMRRYKEVITFAKPFKTKKEV